MIWMALACLFAAAFGHGIRNAQARGRNMAWVGAWNYLVAALACWVWQAMSPAAPLGRDAALFGLLSGAFFGVGYLALHACIRAAGVGVTMTANRLAVVIPIGASIFVWGEIPGRLQVCGVALALAAFPFLARGRALPEEQQPGRASAHGKRFGLLALAFVIQGVAQSFMKAYSHSQPVGEMPFLCFLFTAAAAATLVAAAAMERPHFNDFPHGLALGAANVLTTFWFMYALDRMQATEVFLTTSVGTILLSAAAATVLWRERYRGHALLGLVIAAIALVLVNLKDLK